MIHGHGGNIYRLAKKLGCRAKDIIDVSNNINPMGSPPGLMDYLRDKMADICSLPEVDSADITRRMAAFLGITDNRILAGVGTTQFIYTMFPALESSKVLILGPTYADYADSCHRNNIGPHYFLTTPQDQFVPDLEHLNRQVDKFDTVVICNPNNPTGVMLPRDRLIDLCNAHPYTRFVIDESYLSFVENSETASMAGCRLYNVVVLHSLSKIFRLPGLRIGFIIANQPVIERLSQTMLPWSINSLAHAAVQYICDHPVAMTHFINQTREYIIEEKSNLNQKLQANSELTLFPSATNYFLVKLPEYVTAEDVCEKFARKRVLIRNCDNFNGLTNRFIRLAINNPRVNRMIADMLVAIKEDGWPKYTKSLSLDNLAAGIQ